MNLSTLRSLIVITLLAGGAFSIGACSSNEKPQLERHKAQQTRQRSDNADRELDQAMDETDEADQSR